MNFFIEDFNSLNIVRTPHNFSPLLVPRKTKMDEISLNNKGFYNGSILICTSYEKNENRIIANCSSFNFFDILLKRFKNKPIPLIVSTNGIIQVEKDYFILIKRDKKVYAYKDYWDFPAGLVPYQEDPLNRLTNRIVEEIGIDKRLINPRTSPSFIEVQKEIFANYFALYYIYHCDLSKIQLEELFKNNKNGIKKILLHKSQVIPFLEKNKKVYPKNVLRKIIIGH